MTPPEAERAAPGDWRTYGRLLSYVRKHWFLFLIAVLGFQLGSAAEAFFVKLLGDLIDSWPAAALTVPLLMVGAAMLRGVGEIIGELLLSRISFTVVHRLRTELFEQLLGAPSSYFDASNRGHLVSRITYNVAQLRDTGTDALKTIVQDGGKLIVYLAFLAYLSWKLTLIFVATAPLVAVVVIRASRRFRRISRRIQDSMGDVTHVAGEAVSGYRIVRAFGGERYERERFARASDSNRRQNLKLVRTKVTSTQIVQVFVASALAVLIALLLRPELGGAMSVGDVVAFLGLAGLLARPIKKLSEVNARLQRGLAAAEDVFTQLDAAVETDGGSRALERARGELDFEHVSFGYEQGDGSVLDDLTLHVDAGSTVALVGPSGSGKTTLASLIPRFYEPSAGRVLLDGVPLEEYRLKDLRRQLALVGQDVTLFNDSVRGNIAYGDLADADEDTLWQALRNANADAFVEALPDGLDTQLGDDGVLLSGGQRQRIAIARALLKDAPLLLLDEATSALDSASERQIQSALETLMAGRTTLVIAHRLASVEKADLIVVMDEGRIVDRGDHDSLLARGGLYADLYAAQHSEAPDAVPATPPTARRRRRPRRLPGTRRLRERLPRAWYSGARWPRLLMPFAWLFGRLAQRRRLRYLSGAQAPWRAPVPVLVVGNITAGGTGKTPFVIWLVEQLLAAGYRPGIVLRGYGGRRTDTPLIVDPDTPVEDAGDEALLLRRRTDVPIVAGADRCEAVRTLVSSSDCNLVVCDDGLQHYALARDVEIALVDGLRGFGNGRLLPAGPLRERPERLAEVDWVIASAAVNEHYPDADVMTIVPVAFVAVRGAGALADGTQARLSVEEFLARHKRVNAVAGIGNPARFLRSLEDLGLKVHLRELPDHHRFKSKDLAFDDDAPVVITEKDAIKVELLEELPETVFYLEIDVSIESNTAEAAEAKLDSLLRAHGVRPS